MYCLFLRTGGTICQIFFRATVFNRWFPVFKEISSFDLRAIGQLDSILGWTNDDSVLFRHKPNTTWAFNSYSYDQHIPWHGIQNLSWSSWVQLTYSYPVSGKQFSYYPTTRSSNCPTNILYAFRFFHIRITGPAHLIILDLMTLVDKVVSNFERINKFAFLR
jgi:hypothetical protein